MLVQQITNPKSIKIQLIQVIQVGIALVKLVQIQIYEISVSVEGMSKDILPSPQMERVKNIHLGSSGMGLVELLS